MSETKIEIPGISPGNITMDLVRFKNDILKDIRAFELSLNDKYLKAGDYIKENISKFELKINSFNKKITELSNLIITDNSIREKVESLIQFKEEMKDSIFKRRARFNDFETRIDNNINRINNILTDSVIYPSLIGKTAKFKTFHEFIDYVVRELAQLNIFKEKSGLDLTPYKRKIDRTIDAFKIQMNNFSSRNYIDHSINQTEEKLTNLLKIYEDRLEKTRIENSQYAFVLQKKAEEMEKEMEKFQNDMAIKLESINNNDENSNDINYIKNRLNKINQVIKELLSYHPSTKKNFIHDFEKKTTQVYSGVKQYIKGNINANELSSMKRFTYEKSKTGRYDKGSPPPNTTPFPSPEAIKNNLYQKRNSQILNNTKLLFINSHSNNKRGSNILNENTINFFNIKKFNEPEINNINIIDNNKNNEIFKRNINFKRKTFNAQLNSFESSKLNNEREKEKNNNRIRIIKENENKIEEEKHSKNIIKYINNNNDNSFSNISKDENTEKNEINQINQNSIIVIHSRKESVNNNELIIKEEDENIASDNSCKNLDFCPRKKNRKNKSSNKYSNKEIDNKNYNKNEEINKNSIINVEDKNINHPNTENDKIKFQVLKEAINLNNSDNNTIQILSLKTKLNNSDNNEKLILFGEKNKNINNNKNTLFKNNLNTNNMGINSLKIFPQTTHNKSNSIEMKNNKDINLENINKKSIKNNSSFPKTSKNIMNNSIFPKNNIQKSANVINSNIIKNNNKVIRNQVPINYNFKPNNNIISNPSINKTYSSFPKINKDLSVNKIFQYNNFTNSKDMDIFSKTLSASKFSNKSLTKVVGYIKYPKRILLTSPDNIPPNGTIRKNKNIIKHNSSANINEKEVKNKKIQNMYNNDYYLPYQLNSTDEEIYKSMKILKVNKSP